MGEVKTTYAALGECGKKLRAIDDIVDILGGKWKLAIMAHLCGKPMRYSELMRDIVGVSGKVLSRELKDLEMNWLIRRVVSQESPVSVTYELTEYGISLKELTDDIADWGMQHRERVFRAKSSTS